MDAPEIEADHARILKKMNKLLYEKESYEIRGACFWVYREFGGDFKESVIHNALVKELSKRGLVINTQKRINLLYDGEKVGTYVPDIIVNDIVLVELKCKQFLTKEDSRQFWRYLKASPYKLGLLVNFGPRRLEIKRRVYDKARSAPRKSASSGKWIRVRSASK